MDFNEDDTCFLCGEREGSMAHLIGRCKKLEHIRTKNWLIAATCSLTQFYQAFHLYCVQVGMNPGGEGRTGGQEHSALRITKRP